MKFNKLTGLATVLAFGGGSLSQPQYNQKSRESEPLFSKVITGQGIPVTKAYFDFDKSPGQKIDYQDGVDVLVLSPKKESAQYILNALSGPPPSYDWSEEEIFFPESFIRRIDDPQNSQYRENVHSFIHRGWFRKGPLSDSDFRDIMTPESHRAFVSNWYDGKDIKEEIWKKKIEDYTMYTSRP